MQVPEMSRICEAKLLKDRERDYGPYMLIARHLLQNRARIASVVNEELINLETDHDDLPGLLAAGTDFGTLPTGEHTPLAEAKLLAPVGAPPAILAVGTTEPTQRREEGRFPQLRSFSLNITIV